MISITPQAYYSRAKRCGWTIQQTRSIPLGYHKWIWEIEQEEGMPITEVIKRERRAGCSYQTIARSFGVHRETLRRHINNWKREGLL